MLTENHGVGIEVAVREQIGQGKEVGDLLLVAFPSVRAPLVTDVGDVAGHDVAEAVPESEALLWRGLGLGELQVIDAADRWPGDFLTAVEFDKGPFDTRPPEEDTKGPRRERRPFRGGVEDAEFARATDRPANRITGFAS